MGIDIAVPKWLGAVPRQTTGAQLLATGLFEFVSASFHAAVGPLPLAGDPKGALKWKAGMSLRLAKLPHRAGFDLTASPGTVHIKLVEAMSRHLSSGAGEGTDVVDLLQGFGFATSREAFVESSADPFTDSWWSPQGLMKSAMARLRREADAKGLLASDCSALIAIGAASHGLRAHGACRSCWRWAVPGRTHCSAHALSDEAGGGRSEREANYVRARRVAAKVDWPRAPRVNRLDEAGYLVVVGRLLWDRLIPDAERTARAIGASLQSAPRVLQMLATSLPNEPEALFEHLRLRLDPYEVRPGAWLKKIAAASAWLDAEVVATPGRRTVGANTEDRLEHATHLAAQHRVSREDMPLAMGVSRQAFEALLTRNPDRPAVTALLRAWEASREDREKEQRLEMELAQMGPHFVRTKFGAPLVKYDESMLKDEEREQLDQGEELEDPNDSDDLHEGTGIESGEDQQLIKPPAGLWQQWRSCGCPVSERDQRIRSAYAKLMKQFWLSWDELPALVGFRSRAISRGWADWAHITGLRMAELAANPSLASGSVSEEREVPAKWDNLSAIASRAVPHSG